MKKSKFATGLIIIITLILAGVAIFTAIRLYQLRQTSVAPNVPSSKPQAAENSCRLSFTFTTQTSTPTATPTATATATATPTATATATATPTSPPNSCGGTCGSNFNCGSELVCYNGYCRNPSCTAESDCVCNGTPAPTATPPVLPQSGTDWPTMAAAGLGILVILGSLLLAI